MHSERPVVESIAAAMVRSAGPAPRCAVVLGSGLGGTIDQLVVEAEATYPELGLPGSTVPGHAGRWVVGRLAGVRVVMLAGRVHLYEGHPPQVVVRGVRALAAWGVQELLLTCSVGGIRADLQPGTLTVVTDHLNFQRANPLTGPAYGTRFPDLSEAYHPALRARLAAAAGRVGIPLPEVVLGAMPGPAYETPAEIRMLGRLGADVVGMSTVPEVLAAAEIALPAAAIAVVSNPAAGLHLGRLTHDEVTTAARRASATVTRLIEEFVA